ncbi:MAG: ABC transporter ATP-binding protein [Desulfobacula sp.]|uniref:ABC transporter ATP-binding protein n=1 Tax=Desulfobacula sp. TaxID=2593537 RepID=UPI0025C6A485|nr:ABC transporter ATP-binding protein [Desulfobacula sp.]MCD4722378.1 ABC transporter ATP-binding protein [Desulfobacula sp.]
MIQILNLKKQYKKATVLDNICLEIGKQETVVVVGPSGSGKTTLLRLIAGLEKPDAGEIYIQGIKSSKPQNIIIPPNRRRLGMIFQDLALWPHMTARENIELGLISLGMSKNKRKQKLKKMRGHIDIDSFINRYPEHLSGGEKQKVALARTLILEPDILLMDEPLNSLDTVQKDDILLLIKQLVKLYKITMIYVTHNREEALFMSDRICVMSNGRIVQTGVKEELVKNPKSKFIQYFFKG